MRLRVVTSAWLMLMVTLPSALAYPSGAPPSTCDSMMPDHPGGQLQSTPAPYTISMADAPVDGEALVQVTLSGKNGQTFKGFIIKAIPESGAAGTLGSFQPPTGDGGEYKRLQCDSTQTSREAATHTSRSIKEKIVLNWVAPADFSGRVKFVATVLQEYSTYWRNVASDTLLTINRKSSSARPKQFIPASAPPAGGRPESSGSPNVLKMFNYKNCGATVGCFGYPDKCVSSSSCDMLLSYAPSRVNSDEVDFQLQGQTDGYVSVGFSTDRMMGGDAVVQCVLDSSVSKVLPYISYNVGHSNRGVARLDSKLTSASDFLDGVVRCVFSQKQAINVPPLNATFRLDTTPYYLFLARGPAIGGGNIGKHNLVIRSSRPVGMSDMIIVSSNAVDVEILIHGSLMVIAWVGTVSIAVYMARYFKDMWPDKTHCGVKIWFAWHRSMNALTVLLTVAAFILIFVYRNGLSPLWDSNPHIILGIVTTGLMLLQPLGALCRPHPGTSRRPIFNWLHYLGGMLACGCGIITLFFAVRLPAAMLPEYFWWILIAFVGFYVLMFCVMEFFTCLSSRKSEKEVIPMKEFNGNGGSLNTSASGMAEPQGAKFKLVMLWLFVAGAVGFSAALVAVIVT